jgi:hypothetical protein
MQNKTESNSKAIFFMEQHTGIHKIMSIITVFYITKYFFLHFIIRAISL